MTIFKKGKLYKFKEDFATDVKNGAPVLFYEVGVTGERLGNFYMNDDDTVLCMEESYHFKITEKNIQTGARVYVNASSKFIFVYTGDEYIFERMR